MQVVPLSPCCFKERWRIKQIGCFHSLESCVIQCVCLPLFFPDVCCRNIACSTAAETRRCLLILVSLPGPTGKGGFGWCHSGTVEIESAKDLSVCLNQAAVRRAVCLFAFGCTLEYLPDSVLELTGSCRTPVSLYFIMSVLLHTAGSLEAAWLWLFLCFTGPLLVCQWQSLWAGDSERWENLQTRPRKQCLYFSR